MTLSPLATIADLEARGVTVTTDETGAVNTFLDVASAIVREAAGSPISSVTSTVTLEGVRDARLHLPSRPVTDVDTVLLDGNPVVDYTLTGNALWHPCGWQRGHQPSSVVVAYTAGYATVPADVVDIVCRLAARALVSFRSTPDGTGIADRTPLQERIGDYSATYSYTAQFSDVELPQYIRDRLSARFGPGPAVLVRSR